MLTFNRLNISISDINLLNSISVSLLPGAIINFYGPNGIGKTSLLRKIASLDHIRENEVFYNGNDITIARNEYKMLLSYLGHENAHSCELATVEEELSFWAKIYSTKELIPAAIKCFDLIAYTSTTIGDLSAGWKRKLSLARFLLNYSKIWIIDEPFANLDTDSKNRLLEILYSRANQNGIVILANHEPMEEVGIINFDLRSCANV